MRTSLFASAAFAAMMLAVFSSRGAESAPGTNLLRNPSFEERSGPARDGEPWGKGYLDGVARSPFAHWGYSGFWEGGDYDIKLGAGYSGKLCARLVCRQKGRGGIGSAPVRAAAGSKLQFRGFFKAIGGLGGTCRVNFEGEPGDGFASIALPAKPDYDWTEVTGTITVPVPKGKKAGDTVEVLVFIYLQTYGELWIDDLTLMPVQ
jgi:hypothetical protein